MKKDMTRHGSCFSLCNIQKIIVNNYKARKVLTLDNWKLLLKVGNENDDRIKYFTQDRTVPRAPAQKQLLTFSPVHNARKFSAALGVLSANR